MTSEQERRRPGPAPLGARVSVRHRARGGDVRRIPGKLSFEEAATLPVVVLFYLLVGGRSYCSWVCPVNLLTDLAYWLRVRLGLKGSAHISRPTRYWMLGMTLVAAAVTGSIAWEMLNPVSMMHRGLIFGLGLAWAVLLAVAAVGAVAAIDRGGGAPAGEGGDATARRVVVGTVTVR